VRRALPRFRRPPTSARAQLLDRKHLDARRDEPIAQVTPADYLERHPGYEAAHVEKLMRSSNPGYAEGRARLIESLREVGMP
jgi:hypothetical protein